MEHVSHVSGQISIDAADCVPRNHCEHDDGRISLALTPEFRALPIYIRGTADELLDLAAKIVAAVPRHACEWGAACQPANGECRLPDAS